MAFGLFQCKHWGPTRTVDSVRQMFILLLRYYRPGVQWKKLPPLAPGLDGTHRPHPIIIPLWRPPPSYHVPLFCIIVHDTDLSTNVSYHSLYEEHPLYSSGNRIPKSSWLTQVPTSKGEVKTVCGNLSSALTGQYDQTSVPSQLWILLPPCVHTEALRTFHA